MHAAFGTTVPVRGHARQSVILHRSETNNFTCTPRRPRVTNVGPIRVSAPSMLASESPSDGSGPSVTTAAIENVVIIGSGPGGYTAGLYAGRANLKPVILEGVASGVPGGQLMTTSDVDNFPGFPDGVSGPDLMRAMRTQAERAGAELIADDAVTVDLEKRPFEIGTSGRGVVRAHSIVIATGASAKRLRIPGEDKFWSRGISACAICDGAAPIYSGKELAVVGGGDSACEEAVYLTKYATKVHLLVRGSELRASKILQDRVRQHPNVQIHFETVVLEPLGAKAGGSISGSPMRALRVRSRKEEKELSVRGMFYAIGHTPNTSFLSGSGLKVDGAGYLITTPGSAATNVEGVYAAGDVADSEWRQAITAAGTGCMAALLAERWLTEKGLGVEYHVDQSASAMPGKAAVEANESETEKRTASRGDDDEMSYDIEDTWHKGSLALRKLYHESDRPVVVKYVSPNCGPCGMLKPILHAVIRSMESEVHFVEIDITADPEVAESAGVMGSPTVQVFYKKALIEEFRGVRMKSDYRKVIQKVMDESKSGASL